jgi:hypothetical protein
LSFLFWTLYFLFFFDLQLLLYPYGFFKLFYTSYH